MTDAVTHLLTVVEIDDGGRCWMDDVGHLIGAPSLRGSGRELTPPTSPRWGTAPAGTVSFWALHLAVLRDGRRVVLLDDRGWSVCGPVDIWRHCTAEEIEADARAVVGPDEPVDSDDQAELESSHWSDLAARLRSHGIQVVAEELRQLRHDVELSARVRSRLADPATST